MSKRLGSPAAVKHIIKVVSYQISLWVYCHDRDCDIFESCHLKIELFPYDEEMLILKKLLLFKRIIFCSLVLLGALFYF